MGEHKSYVAIAPCGCLKMACVDNPDHRKETAKEVASCIRSGLEIRYIDMAEVRAYPWLCPTHRAERDARLVEAGRQKAML